MQFTLVQRLREVIAALDRRSPQPARPAEAAIRRDASALRRRATEELARLERASTSPEGAR